MAFASFDGINKSPFKPPNLLVCQSNKLVLGGYEIIVKQLVAYSTLSSVECLRKFRYWHRQIKQLEPFYLLLIPFLASYLLHIVLCIGSSRIATADRT